MPGGQVIVPLNDLTVNIRTQRNQVLRFYTQVGFVDTAQASVVGVDVLVDGVLVANSQDVAAFGAWKFVSTERALKPGKGTHTVEVRVSGMFNTTSAVGASFADWTTYLNVEVR